METCDSKKNDWMKLKEIALAKHKAGKRLTLEETAAAIWDPESGKKPMTCMGIQKIEKRALDKLRLALKRYGINDLSDIFEPKYREYAKPISSIYSK